MERQSVYITSISVFYELNYSEPFNYILINQFKIKFNGINNEQSLGSKSRFGELYKKIELAF